MAMLTPTRIVGECHPVVPSCVLHQDVCGEWRCNKYTDWIVSDLHKVNKLDGHCKWRAHECFYPKPARETCPTVWDAKHPCKFNKSPLRCDKDACCRRKGKHAEPCRKAGHCKWVDCDRSPRRH